MIYWNTSDVTQAIIGGVFFSTASIIYLLVKDHYLSISQSYNHIITFNKHHYFSSFSLIGSIIVFTSVLRLFYHDQDEFWISGSSQPFDDTHRLISTSGVIGACIGGFFVGLGSSIIRGDLYNNWSFQNVRSPLALLIILLFGVITSTVKYYNVPYDAAVFVRNQKISEADVVAYIVMGIGIIFVLFSIISAAIFMRSDLLGTLLAVVIGGCIAIGLLLSGFIRVSKVQHLLTIADGWDPSLLFTIASAIVSFIILRAITFAFIKKQHMDDIDLVKPLGIWPVFIGSLFFGFGWGICGLDIANALGLYQQFTLEIGVFYLAFAAFGLFTGYFYNLRLDRIELEKNRQSIFPYRFTPPAVIAKKHPDPERQSQPTQIPPVASNMRQSEEERIHVQENNSPHTQGRTNVTYEMVEIPV